MWLWARLLSFERISWQKLRRGQVGCVERTAASWAIGWCCVAVTTTVTILGPAPSDRRLRRIPIKGTALRVCRGGCVALRCVVRMNSYALGLSEHITRSAPTALARHGRPVDNVSLPRLPTRGRSGEVGGRVGRNVDSLLQPAQGDSPTQCPLMGPSDPRHSDDLIITTAREFSSERIFFILLSLH